MRKLRHKQAHCLAEDHIPTSKEQSCSLKSDSRAYREGNGTPLQYPCLENPMHGGAWRAAVHGVTKSRTELSDFTFTFHFHALEKEMATHSSVLAWRIPGTVEPGGLLSMRSQRGGHDWSNLAAARAYFVHYYISRIFFEAFALKSLIPSKLDNFSLLTPISLPNSPLSSFPFSLPSLPSFSLSSHAVFSLFHLEFMLSYSVK